MKKKIGIRLCVIGIISSLLSAILISISFYYATSEMAWSRLKDLSDVLIHENDQKKLSETLPQDVRITIINPDGSVRYDNQSDIKKMDNHSNREEVLAAKNVGVGEKYSKISYNEKNTYYYAVRMKDGVIFRVSLNSNSVLSTFTSTLHIIVVIFC